jgi:V8-like Glu-specific endopeptidase
MRWLAVRARCMRRRGCLLTVFTVLATAAACGAVLLVPANVGATAVSEGSLVAGPSADEPPTGQAFDGVATVGALFTMNGGQLGTHFCTASVVDSAHGDLIVTAAHCVTGRQGQIAFVPGYAKGPGHAKGKAPYGVWPVTAVYANQAWQSAQDPDDDFAFLRVSPAGGGAPIQEVTGGDRLGIDWREPALVRVIGYPDQTDQPITCTNRTKVFTATQLEFDCGGYTDGTSGGPFLADASASSGQGVVVGVIGGYQQGGDTPEVSYAAVFGAATEALYQQAQAGG